MNTIRGNKTHTSHSINNNNDTTTTNNNWNNINRATTKNNNNIPDLPEKNLFSLQTGNNSADDDPLHSPGAHSNGIEVIHQEKVKLDDCLYTAIENM